MLRFSMRSARGRSGETPVTAMVTLADVRRWDPQLLDSAARALHAACDELEGQRARLRAARPGEDRWQGVAADRARSAHDARDTHLRRLSAGWGEAVPVFTGAADAVADLHEELRRLDGAAVETGYTITHDGDITDNADTDGAYPGDSEPAREQEDRHSGAMQIRAGLAGVLERAARIDASLLTALQDAMPPDPALTRPVGGVHLVVASGPVRGLGREFVLPLPTYFPKREQPQPQPQPQPPTSTVRDVAASPAAPVVGIAPADAFTSTPDPVAGLARADAAAAAAFDPALLGDGADVHVAGAGALPAGTDEAGTVVVAAPDPRTGARDSLWRIAARELGNGALWPEIFALNRGDPQPGGHTFDQPGLIFPGEHLRLPTTSPDLPDDASDGDASAPDNPPAAPDTDPSPPTSGHPLPPPTTGHHPSSTPPPPPPPTSSTPTSPTANASQEQPVGPGVSVGPEVFVGAGLAVAVIAALLIGPRGNRHRLRSELTRHGDAGDDAAAVGPVPSRPDGPHTAATGGSRGNGRGGAAAGESGDPAMGGAAPGTSAPADSSTRPSAAARPRPRRWATRLQVGARAGREIAFDLAIVPGLGIDGAAGPAVVRALTVNALGVNLTADTPGAPAPVEVLITAAGLAELLDQELTPPDLPAGLHVVDELGQLLVVAETAIAARTRADVGDPAPGSTLVLVTAAPSGPDAARLQAVLAAGRGCGVVGVLWGDWRGGVCVHARRDGLVWAAGRGPGDSLRDVRLYGLSAAETLNLLAMLHGADSASEIPSAIPAVGGASTPPVLPTTPAAADAEAAVAAEDVRDTDDPMAAIRTALADPRETAAVTETATTSPSTPSGHPGSSEPGQGASVGGLNRIAAALAPPDRATGSAAQPDPPAPALGIDEDGEDGEDDDPAGGDAAGGDVADGDVVGGTAAQDNVVEAEPQPDSGSAVDTIGADAVSGGPLIEPGPITLRILGRPMLLVDRTPSDVDDRQRSAGATAGVEPVDPAGAVEVTATLSARMRDLLVYLAVHPDGVRRDAAVADLWPDTGRQRPGNNLSSLISRLRAALRGALDTASDDGHLSTPGAAGPDLSRPGADRVGPIVLVEGDRYRLDPDHIAVDYWTFLSDTAAATSVREAAGGPGADPVVLERLARAHALYRGLLAEGIEHAWIPSIREATRRTFLDLTARLVRHHVATDPAAALQILETTRNLEPTNQSIYRDIMALQLRRGDNEAAAATMRLLENQLADVEESIDDVTRAVARAATE